MKIPALLVATMTALAASLALNSVSHAEIDRPECIAPAKPGGGFDLTCKLAQQGLQDLLPGPMRVTYMPGGIGAVAYNTIIAQRPDDSNAIVAFSGGSLLNLAQGKFGRYNENDVRWLAAIGSDCSCWGNCFGVSPSNPCCDARTKRRPLNWLSADERKYHTPLGGR